MYERNAVHADLVITDPARGCSPGPTCGPVGVSPPDRGMQADVQILAHSPVVCWGHRSFHDMTYVAPSGAGVFAAGTNL